MTLKLYTNTDVLITLIPGTGFIMTDVVFVSVNFTKIDGTASLTLTSGTSAVVLGSSSIDVNIPDSGGIDQAGVYKLRVTMIDTVGNIRGLTPDTENLIFY